MHLAVQAQDCRVVWKYQAAAAGASAAAHLPHSTNGGSGARYASVPAALQDFLSLHEDVLALDVPQLLLALPFAAPQPPPAGVGHSDATLLQLTQLTLSVGTMGCPGHAMLPALQLSSVVVQRAGAPGAGAAPPAFRLRAETLDLGSHPSHLGMLAAAVHLGLAEYELLLREAADGTFDGGSVVTSTTAPPPGLVLSLPAAQRRGGQPPQLPRC